LVTCAGLGLSGLLLDQDEEEWTRVIDVNLNGTYRAIRAALPQMMAQGRGRIITIASILGKMGGYGFVSAYAASKHGVVGLTRALAAELGAQGFPGITVNAICPGYVRAGMGIALQSTKAGPVSGTEIFERYYKRLVPQRRMIEAEEIAHAALRESEEEVGLSRTAVEALGALDDTETFATRFVITPWVGVIRAPVVWRPDGEEIEKVIEVPLAALLEPANFRVEHWARDGVVRPVYFYEYGGERIWGATARIVKDYLDLVTGP